MSIYTLSNEESSHTCYGKGRKKEEKNKKNNKKKKKVKKEKRKVKCNRKNAMEVDVIGEEQNLSSSRDKGQHNNVDTKTTNTRLSSYRYTKLDVYPRVEDKLIENTLEM